MKKLKLYFIQYNENTRKNNSTV